MAAGDQFLLAALKAPQNTKRTLAPLKIRFTWASDESDVHDELNNNEHHIGGAANMMLIIQLIMHITLLSSQAQVSLISVSVTCAS
jgi:hypothetical protein